MNKMKEVRIEKVTLNIGSGKDQKRLENSTKLMKTIAGTEPVKTHARKRIPEWGLRPGLPIGCKLTLRKQPAIDILKRMLDAKENTLKEDSFDNAGNVAFGVPEYIDIPNVKYDPDIGIMGLEVCVTLERPGFRIKRKKNSTRIGKHHKITKEEAIKFMVEKFNVKVS